MVAYWQRQACGDLRAPFRSTSDTAIQKLLARFWQKAGPKPPPGGCFSGLGSRAGPLQATGRTLARTWPSQAAASADYHARPTDAATVRVTCRAVLGRVPRVAAGPFIQASGVRVGTSA